jgi:phosphate:Na+ symporter
LWWVADWLSGADGVADLSTGLAAFHTVFNLLGLLLMVIVGERIIARAEAVYKMPLLRSGEPRYLDKTVLQIPSMGLNALHQEQKRVFKQYLLRLRGLLEPGTASDDGDTNVATGQLLAAITDFAQRLNQQSLHGQEALALADLHGVRYRLYDLRQLVEHLEQLRNSVVDGRPESRRRDASVQLLYLTIVNHNQRTNVTLIGNVKHHLLNLFDFTFAILF